MEKSKYLRMICKKLRCGTAKKKEIVKQIESDISIAMEGGKSFEEVMENMGNPVEVAREFNENFSEEEVKLGKRQKRLKTAGIILGVIIVLLAVIFWILPKAGMLSDSNTFSEEELTKKAKEVIKLIDENDMEALNPLMTEQMQEFLTEEILQGSKTAISDDFGAFLSWGKVYSAEISQAGMKTAVLEITVSYENAVVTYRLSFDENMLLSGLYMR